MTVRRPADSSNAQLGSGNLACHTANAVLAGPACAVVLVAGSYDCVAAVATVLFPRRALHLLAVPEPVHSGGVGRGSGSYKVPAMYRGVTVYTDGHEVVHAVVEPNGAWHPMVYLEAGGGAALDASVAVAAQYVLFSVAKILGFRCSAHRVPHTSEVLLVSFRGRWLRGRRSSDVRTIRLCDVEKERDKTEEHSTAEPGE